MSLGCSHVCVRLLEVLGENEGENRKRVGQILKAPFLLLLQTLQMLGADLGR